MTRDRQPSPSKLYKDPKNGKLMGVCAGLGDYTGIKPNYIRIALVLGAIFGFFFWILIGYLILGFVLEPKPEGLYADAEEERFWRGVRTRPQATSAELRRRFRDIDERIRRMESYVTSKRFSLDRELRDLER